MRLTFINFLNKVRPHGHLYRGKNGKVRKITFADMTDLQKDFEREERNMLILRHPYLSIEQSHGYMKELKADQPKPLHKRFKAFKFEKTYSFSEALSHLKVKEAWD